MADDTPERDASLAQHVDELLNSVKDSMEEPQRSGRPRAPGAPEPPPLPARDPQGLDDSLAASLGELLESVSDTVDELEPSPAPPTVVPRGAMISLVQPSLSEARSFYEELLGLTPRAPPSAQVARYDLGGDAILELREGTATVTEPPESEAVTLHFFVADVQETERRLREASARAVTGGDRPAVSLRDPAGHRIALTAKPGAEESR